MKEASPNQLRFILFVAILIWLKTYIVYKLSFHFKIENTMQEFILFLSPLSSVLFLVGISLFLEGKKRTRFILFVSISLSLLLSSNILFYTFFDDFITLPVLFQTNNFGDLGASIQQLIDYKILIAFADVIILLFVIWKVPSFIYTGPVSRPKKNMYFITCICIFLVNLTLAEIQRPQLLTRSFDREMLVKNLGLYTYHLYDAILQSKTSVQRALADGNKLTEVENYISAKYPEVENDSFFGIAKGKNIIMVSMESTQSFLLNQKINGQEITPFLNKFAKQSYSFPNFYHQTGQGKTSDAEFLIENSLYPLDRGAVFFTHPNNEYVALPELLKPNGYYSAVFHANNKSFWNRDVIYPAFGYDRYFHNGDYETTPETSTQWGLKDKEFFKQSIPYLTSLQQPFYTKLITLTNHYPFDLPEEEQMLPPYDSNDQTLNRYFQTVRYMDEALEQFIQDLKDAGLYDNSVIILYGDHYGISENHNKAMAAYLDKESITPFDHIQLQRVPLFVHIPEKKGKVIPTVSGEIDVKPTILHLLGISSNKDFHFGQQLFAKKREEFIILRDDSFITKDLIYTKGVCYDKKTGEETEMGSCTPYIHQSKAELEYSDNIIYSDLLRFFPGNKYKTGELKTDY
ncbi:LTA synthase family protein [Priestia taiwanensis]|uniref:Phosphoglycerol transferase n=1 Tax=Priestia taiwanensis TaxID=1347902 RepID=A0A917AR40_9BACI|nr:LTA synthase family protein [Priestia taiwanensis]MBM7363117.1 phosphoglycerol transferase MdoB-like AlkP superfamily enzyme [Priestia taiwanensis]GGE67824.1 phosphoglycerol transferase [Priestia taiwanensis]